MEAILAGRQDLAFKLAGLGFVTHAYAAGINRDQRQVEPLPAAGTSNPDSFSHNARFIKAAICAGVCQSLLQDQIVPAACHQPGTLMRWSLDAASVLSEDPHFSAAVDYVMVKLVEKHVRYISQCQAPPPVSPSVEGARPHMQIVAVLVNSSQRDP